MVIGPFILDLIHWAVLVLVGVAVIGMLFGGLSGKPDDKDEG